MSEPNPPPGFEPLFRTSPFLDTVGPLFYRRDPDRGLIAAVTRQKLPPPGKLAPVRIARAGAAFLQVYDFIELFPWHGTCDGFELKALAVPIPGEAAPPFWRS